MGGTFEWVDQFLQKNTAFTELSDRMIVEWAAKSGLRQQKGASSVDKPGLQFGYNDFNVGKMLAMLAPTLKRNLVVMELASNLVSAKRIEALKKFSHFKKVAHVMMGEPSQDFVQALQAQILAEKQNVLDAEFAKKVADAKKKFLA